ncbi:protein-L-isoaspartate O-methyltransferase family protein [Neisseria weaveri]|uniref:Protein-L-isoaspartate O-methyltransferase n=1 Tax=Neisseria weaveri TaxID=28091 RepID=A0A448VPX6_9NEIS|nr:methyltransferase domain-containing protein [Neisseria weaveri]EGV35493.1 hypothetical protein l13_15100 [Neisseria weaveri ATCC 51223]EGV37760.1 hypothetical protein l11_10010 [Neisseria weaveri LMG 5135]SAY50456.1 protein-L-isoaspartate O-methyltransferase [Neisseria weaveri]VEJ51865.1 protein-L-isoaspartate O-methyltransferase [Neisseria weaveri]
MANPMAGFENRGRRMAERLAAAGIGMPVCSAMMNVPRHWFVEEALRTHAYSDKALPLGFGRMLPTPYQTAVGVELLLGSFPHGLKRVLELGTGSGYQTAVLQLLDIPEFYSIEPERALHETAKDALRHAGISSKVRLVCGKIEEGLPEAAPFDGMILNEAVEEIPVALLEQLAVGGRLAAQIMVENEVYWWLVEKSPQGYRENKMQRIR